MPATVDGDLPTRPAAAVETASYFTIAEALTNVAKHAGAGHAHVTIAGNDEQASVEIRDDGRGGADPGNRSGLRGLAERVAAVGGELEVDSDTSGTTVHAVVPLHPRGPEDAVDCGCLHG